MKINIKNLLLLILIIISISTIIALFRITEKSKGKNQGIYDTVNSQLLFISNGVSTAEDERDLRLLASTAGGIYYMSTYSDKFNYDNMEFFYIMQAFFVSVEIEQLNELNTELSYLIENIAINPEDKASRDKIISIMNEYIE